MGMYRTHFGVKFAETEWIFQNLFYHFTPNYAKINARKNPAAYPIPWSACQDFSIAFFSFSNILSFFMYDYMPIIFVYHDVHGQLKIVRNKQENERLI